MNWRLSENIQTSAGLVAAGNTGRGPALVLAHGWPWSSYSWHRIIPALAEDFTVYWYDMPGYGKSEMYADQTTSLDVQGSVFAEMIHHWSLTHPIVVAHDFGGATTLRAHLLGGIDFAAYVLINVVAMRPWGSPFFDHVGKHIDAFLGLPPHIHEAVVRSYIKGALVNDIASSDFDALVAPWITENGRTSFYRQFAQADEKYTAEIEPLFEKLRCKAAIIWGRDDPWIPLDRGRALQKCIGTDEFIEIPDIGHLPQLEDAPLVVKTIRSIVHNFL